ncbi:ASCH domain-containing protein [Paenibacillus sp. OK003]|uniref:ASCH domain-containing protein n=1 Tax=Paenibacillus sp. OK003 TaxID=1884380 RepID=UPI0008ACDEFD|nr:ASCH domain-containing protein [Paenibacillus sp. OK003]SEM04916.1 Predicted transcriptional regulator, contains an HTH and PUA-like domains [Paenibacillus sp. OK003]
MKVLLSIKPEFVEKIFSEEKRYEYRKIIFKQKVDSVVIYSTMPEGRIVGEFSIDKILSDDPDSIWDITNRYSGITHNFFKKYFNNKENAYAIKIGEIERYEEPINPKDFDFPFTAPQSFFYVDDDFRPISQKQEFIEPVLF